MPYFKDFEVYALWKYLNGNLTGRNVFQFADLQAPNVSESSIVHFLSSFFLRLGVKLEKPVFNMDIYWGFYSNNEDTEKAKALAKILDNKFNVKELESNAYFLEKHEALKLIEFSKTIAKKNRKKLNDYFDLYIDGFTADELEEDDSNYLKFEIQKQKTLELLNEHETKYGKSFILKYKPASDESSPDHNPYLFIHSIIALDRIGDIRIQKAWCCDEVHPDKQIDDFKIKLSVIKEMIGSEDVCECSFDIDRSMLIIGKNEIKIKKFSDQYEVLKIMFSSPEDLRDEWFFSTIAEKYDQTANLPDKKFYNAIYQLKLKLSINNIKDLFITTRQSVKINKKYLS